MIIKETTFAMNYIIIRVTELVFTISVSFQPQQVNLQRNTSVDLTNKQVLQVKPKEAVDPASLERFDGMTQDPSEY